MLKKFVLLFFALSFVFTICFADEPCADMKSFEPTFKSMQAEMTPVMKSKFESLFEKFSNMGRTSIITEQGMLAELNLVFTSGFGQFTKDSAMFYFGYGLYFRNMEMQGKIKPGTHGQTGVRPMFTKLSEIEEQNIGKSNVMLKGLVSKYFEKVKSINEVQE